ncbi:MAG: MFS transporter [Geobacteraceae bacterium]|nr:MFS transporter [Geobacteraceae bacterium]
MSGFRHRYGLFLLLCFIAFATFFCSYLRIPVLPLFAVSLGAGPAQVGVINGAFMLATGILSIPAGVLADRVGPRLPAVGGILAAALSSFLVTQCSTPAQMASAYLLFGVGLAAFVPSMLSQVADSFPVEKLGQAYGWYSTAMYVAITLGPASGGYLGKNFGLRQVFFLSGGLLLLVALLAFAFLPRSAVLRKREPRALLAASFSLFRNRALTACLLATWGTAMGFGIFLSFLPLYASGKGLDPAQVGLVFAAQALSNVFCRIPVGMAADHFDRRWIVAVGMLLFAVGLSLLGLFQLTATLSACAGLLGIGMALTFTAIGALIAESVPPLQRGLAMGMYNSTVYLAMMTGSTTMGACVGATGYATGFALGGGAALVGAFAFLQVIGVRARSGVRL